MQILIYHLLVYTRFSKGIFGAFTQGSRLFVFPSKKYDIIKTSNFVAKSILFKSKTCIVLVGSHHLANSVTL